MKFTKQNRTDSSWDTKVNPSGLTLLESTRRYPLHISISPILLLTGFVDVADCRILCIALLTVRLANSTVQFEGRLEVYYNGTWGTVCDDLFDNVDATVACKSVGPGLVCYSLL